MRQGIFEAKQGERWRCEGKICEKGLTCEVNVCWRSVSGKVWRDFRISEPTQGTLLERALFTRQRNLSCLYGVCAEVQSVVCKWKEGDGGRRTLMLGQCAN
jgi:hypothetical protein